MRIVIISLETQTARIAFQDRQFAGFGLSFERFSAYTPDTLPGEYEAIDPSSWERTLTRSELACLASHREVWRSVAETQEPVLILEDDAVLAKVLPDFLAEVEPLTGIDHLSLEVRKRKKLIAPVPEHIAAGVGLHRLFQDRTGAAAYVLWPSGAGKLLVASKNRAILADALICSSYELASFQTVPGIAMQSDQCELYGIASPLATKSTLVRPRGPKAAKSFEQTWRRAQSQIRLGLRFLSVAARARRMEIPVDTSAF